MTSAGAYGRFVIEIELKLDLVARAVTVASAINVGRHSMLTPDEQQRIRRIRS